MHEQKQTHLNAAMERAAALKSEPSHPQRRFDRFEVRGDVRVVSDRPGENEFYDGQIRDMSRGGMGVLTTREVPLGGPMHIRLSTGRMAIASTPAFCRFSREVSEGIWLCGFAFAMDAGPLLALGVDKTALAEADNPEWADGDAMGGECRSTDDLLNNDAA
jgi:hypothetical protein